MSTWQDFFASNSGRTDGDEYGASRRGATMTLNPIRLYRRLRRLQRDSLEEAQHLRRRHGDMALAAAEEKLRRPEITTWGKLVIRRAIKLLHSQV